MGAVEGYLLDTHTFLWAVQKDIQLSDRVKSVLSDSKTKKFVSAVSAYEIMNKYRLGKLPDYAYLAENYSEILDRFGADELPVNSRHMHFAGKFEWVHRDPFDRILAAQAATDDLALVTNDPVFHGLSWLKVFW